MNTLHIILIFTLLVTAQTFNFKQLITTVDTLVINSIATYTFKYDRTRNNSGLPTNYITETVLSNATVTVTFPTAYNVATATCASIIVGTISITTYGCNTNSNTVTFTNVFTSVSNLSITSITLAVGNVKNPSPAMTLSPFSGTIGTDLATPASPNPRTVVLQPGSFQNCSITFNPSTVNQKNSLMVLQMTPTDTLPANSYLSIDFPTSIWAKDYQFQSIFATSSLPCSNSSANLNSGLICGSNSTSKQINVTNLLLTDTLSKISLQIGNILSPPSNQPSDQITITSYSSGSKIDVCSVYPSGLTPATLTDFIITSPITPLIVNKAVALFFSITILTTITTSDSYSITFPTQVGYTYSLIEGVNVYIDPVQSGQSLSISLNSLSGTATYLKGFIYTIQISNFIAPPSTLTTSPFTMAVLRNGYEIMTGSTSITAGADVLSATVLPNSNIVWANTIYVFTITLTNPITNTGMIKIIFPHSVTINTNSSTCAVLSGISTNSLPICSINQISNSITFSSLSASTNSLTPQTLTLSVSNIINPPDATTTGPFSITTYYTSNVLGVVDTGTASGITSAPGTIALSSVSIVPSSYVVLQSSISLTINFRNTYNIPVGGYVVVQIPLDIPIIMSSLINYCKMTTNGGTFYGTICSGTTTATYNQIIFSSVAQAVALSPNTLISLKIDQLCTNPTNTRIVTPFSIATYSSQAIIQCLSSGITLQMTQPAAFGLFSVSRVSQQNSALTTYSLSFKQQAALPAGSILLITLPSQILMSANSTCTDLSNVVISCTISSFQSLSVVLPYIASNVQFGISISNIRNPGSYKPTTTPFIVITKSNDLISSFASGSFNQVLTNSLPSIFQTISYSFSPGAYGDSQSLTLSITPSALIVPSSFLVQLANSFTPNTLTCHSFIGFTGTCSIVSIRSLNVSGIMGSSQMTFTISGFTSPLSTPIDYTIISSFDSGGFFIDQSKTDVRFNILCNLPCKTCTANSSVCLSCYSNTNVSTFNTYFPSNNSCISFCPSAYYLDTTTQTCYLCGTNCLTCQGFSSNCTSCLSSSAYPALNFTVIGSTVTGTCLSVCPLYFYLSNSTSPTQCTPCIIPCLACTGIVSCLSCRTGYYYYNNACIPNCPLNYTIPNNATLTCDACSTQCATCSENVNNCNTCSSIAAFYNNQCVTSCPYPLVINSGICSSCSSQCKTCSLISTNCTACFSNSSLPFLSITNTSLGSCINQCSFLYYGDIANGACILCSTLNIGCNNCSSISTCYQCNAGFGFVFYHNQCLTYTPSGFFNQTGVAKPCDSVCSTCVNFSYVCTSCVNLSLSNYRCIANCPAGQVSVNLICIPCSYSAFCLTCSNLPNNCTSCYRNITPAVYLTSGSCLQTCPNYTYPNPSTAKCQICTSPCELCLSTSSCISCVNGFFLYNSTCIPNCPDGTVGLDRQCKSCTNSCSKCSGATNFCLSCVTTTYLYNTSSPTCLAVCPNNTYINSTSQSCTGCALPCLTCLNFNNYCLTCSSNLLLFNGTCQTSCNIGYYPLGGHCITCPLQCTSCTSSLSCSACAIGYYYYLSGCIAACPLSMPIIDAIGHCSSCTDTSCVSCSSSNICLQCYYPKYLFNGVCLANCPYNYAPNGNLTDCIYSPNINNLTNSSSSSILTSSLTTSSLFPVPFTIAAGFFAVACLMSKFQDDRTFISGALYSLCGLLEWGAVAFLLAYHYLQSRAVQTLPYLMVAGGFAFNYFLNILFLFVQNISLRKDKRLKAWLQDSCHSCFYSSISFIALITTNKFKNILFCKLFRFRMLSAQLQDLGKLRVYYAFSFISFVSSLTIIGGAVLFIMDFSSITDQLFMSYLDVLILSVLSIILALLNTRKPIDYFQDIDQNGMKVNKRVQSWDEVLNQNVMPQYSQAKHKGDFYKLGIDSSRKLQISGEYLSDGLSHKSMRDISIQAEQILGERSLISRLGTQSISDLDLFQRNNDISIQMDEIKPVQDMIVGHSVIFHDVSVNPSLIMKDQSVVAMQQEVHDRSVDQTQEQVNQVSVQYEMPNKSISIQFDQPEQHQISVQYVPIYTDQTVHMTRDQDQFGIQCNADLQNISVQYSAKPIFQHHEQELNSNQLSCSELQEPSDLEVQKKLVQNIPAAEQIGMKAELELDISQKLQKKKQQLQQLQSERRNRQKQQTMKAFHKKIMMAQEEPSEMQQDHLESNKINQLFNNQSRNAPSSLINSHAEMVEIPFNLHEEPSRVISTQTEQEFIQMLSGNKAQQEQQDHSKVSFSLSQKQQRHQPNFQKQKKVQFQVQNRIFQDPHQQQQLLQQQSSQQYGPLNPNNTVEGYNPNSVQKSRSTNYGTSRRPPLPPSSRNILDSSDNDIEKSYGEEEQIINHPINPKRREYLPDNRYKQEQLEQARKTNLTQFLQKKKRNLSSAQDLGRRNNLMEEDDALTREIQQQFRHQPLPPQRSQQMISQQSVTSFRKQANPTTMIDLQFDNRDRIAVMQQQDELQHEARSLQRKKSIGKSTSQKQLPRTNSRNKIATNDVMLQYKQGRNKGYLRQTFTSQQKRKSLQKIYLNKLVKK